MILPRLKILLAERNLKISRVSNDTGLSRTTLTSLAQNSLKGIQLETIDKLCQYLEIPIDKFFEFVPFNIKVNCMAPNVHKNFKTLTDSETLEVSPFETDLYLIKQSNSIMSGTERETYTLTAKINKSFFIYVNDTVSELLSRSLTPTVEILLGQSNNKESFDMQRDQFNDFINGLSNTVKEVILKKIRTAFITEVNEQLKCLDSSLPDLNFKFTFSNAFSTNKSYDVINVSLAKHIPNGVQDNLNDSLPF